MLLLAPETIAITAFSPADAARLSDDELITQQHDFAVARRLLDAGAAAVSAEIARRSAPELGHTGLAQSRGARTPEALVQHLIGGSAADARTLVAVGTLIADPPAWLTPVATAVTTGGLSLTGATVIRVGLGVPGRVAEEDLTRAAERLVAEAAGLTLEQLAARARQARDTLDVSGVPEREEERRDRRFLTLTRLTDGMTRLAGLLDPESAAIIGGAIDAITSPRRGGPRFVDTTAAPVATADSDTRTIPQLMVDALVDIVQLATKADSSTAKGTKGNTGTGTTGTAKSGRLFGQRRIGVRVHIAQRDLATGEGFAHIEGQSAVVSVATAQRIACDTGIIPIAFDTDGHIINVGREQRYHTHRQRIGLAARDGGCRADGCQRPPDFCEAHHIDEWLRDTGETSIRRGILLCRHHHTLIHNNGWHITETGSGDYEMRAPNGQRKPLPSKNPIAARLRR